MNDVKKSDIALVTDSLAQYLEHIRNTKKVNLQEFVQFMEPKFTDAGYRENTKGGGYGGGNILIIHDAGGGDFVTQSGAIREIRRLYPTAQITLVVSPNGVQLAECCPYVDEILHAFRNWDFNQHFEQSYTWNMEFAKLLLERRFDICYSFTAMHGTPTLMYMSGAKTRISYQLFEESDAAFPCDIPIKHTINLATHIVPPYEFGNHIVDTAFSLVDHFLHMPVANREIEVWYTPTEFSRAKSIIKDFPRPRYALMMGASGFSRHYPPEKYAELIKMILAEEPTAVFINLGGGQIDLYSAQILQQALGEEIFSKHVVNLVNQTNLRIDAAIMSLCDMYIGNNTGNMEVASAVKCPVLVAECFPKDLDSSFTDVPRLFAPYKVPAVSVQPAHALPECSVNDPYNSYGCRANTSHCIAQITPQTLFRGFKLLKEKIAAKIIDTTYISG